MPSQARSEPAAALVELRVLDGPNRFFSRPSVKLEFSAPDPGTLEDLADRAARAVTRLHEGLGLAAPRLTRRVSVDGRRLALAFPWRRRTIGQAIGAAAAKFALRRGSIRRELSSLRSVALGPLPAVPSPRLPVVAVTGTNGKSTTTRLIAHLLAVAGRRVGMTNSDGIFVAGRLIEPGDWTGFGGAGRILAEPGLDVAVLETARGGILLRGLGYDHNDVAVVTNVSPDHLGLQGIDTLDELAEVKATIVRVTRRTGWAVLNADDARVWEMRRETKAQWYAFSLDPRSPAVAAALERGGRAAVAERGRIRLLRDGRQATVATVASVPVAFGGLSRFNIANALAAAAACDALGISPAVIGKGLRSFGRDLEANPGRLNLFERDGVLALVDFAHNEAGLAGLLDVARAVAGAGRVRLALGTAGDRTDEILTRLGELAAAADEVVICEKRHYLRGRDLEEMNEIFRAGLREGGYRRRVPAFASELAALQALVRHCRPRDLAAVMAHVERSEIFSWLASVGFAPVGLPRLRELLARRPRPAGRQSPVSRREHGESRCRWAPARSGADSRQRDRLHGMP